MTKPVSNATVRNLDNKLAAFARLLQIMDELREHCPWDRKQTFDTLRNLTIEETYELADAILEHNHNDIKEELGDVMLHLVFYAKIAEEQALFDIADAIHAICDKLVSRHPHIYGDVKVENEEDVKRNWEQLKLKEGKKSVLSGVPNSMPAMVKAFRMQEKVSKVGFDWADAAGAWAKVREELQEFETAESAKHREEEFGDLLFALTNYARLSGIDPETALERTNKKFKRRFEYIEQNAPKPLTAMNLDDMNVFWEEAKRQERGEMREVRGEK